MTHQKTSHNPANNRLIYIIGAGLLVCVLYIGLRIVSLRQLPLFTDEAIYARWAQQGFFDAQLRLASLSDGKQPFYIWLVSLMMHLIGNPVTAGRLVSVISGFVTMSGLSLLVYLLTRSYKLTLATMLFYAVYPFAVVLDRMALYDSLLGALYVLNLVICYRLSRQPELGMSLLLGFVWGFALLTKSSAVIFLLLSPAVLLLNFRRRDLKFYLKFFSYLITAAVVALILNSVILLSPDWKFISQKNGLFVYGIRELIDAGLFKILVRNIFVFAGWIAGYLSWPVILILAYGVFSYRRKDTNASVLVIMALLPIVIYAFFGKIIYPRYLFFMTLTALPAAVLFMHEILRKRNGLIWLFGAVFAFLIYVDTGILFALPTAMIPAEDKYQYANSYLSGGGLKEITNYLLPVARNRQITIITEGKYGSLPTTTMEIFFGYNPNVRIYPVDDFKNGLPPEILADSRNIPTYVITNYEQQELGWPVTQIASYRKGNSHYLIRLYGYNLNH